MIIQIATALIALIGTMFSGLMAYLMARLNAAQKANAADAATQATQVKRRLKKTEIEVHERSGELVAAHAETHAKITEVQSKLDDVAVDASAAHDLGNDMMSMQLAINVTLARKLANAPGATDADRAELERAILAFESHKQRQDAFDAERKSYHA